MATSLSGSDAPRSTPTTVVQQARTAASPSSAAAIYRTVAPSVVAIAAQATQQSGSPFQESGSGTATGTGFVVGADGLIATNAHVVADATSITVTLADGLKRTAKVVGTDDSTDVALLRISASGLTALRFADSATVAVGDPVYAIGNPYGLDRSLTTGVISALNRDITAPNGFAISGVLQTDAALNPGNSGGPLLDAAGRVVGITSQIETSSSTGDGSSSGGNTGIGFAVPANVVRRVVSTLGEGRTVRHGYSASAAATRRAAAHRSGPSPPAAPPRTPACAQATSS